ncbi:MAG: glycoside hydrolase family 3 C-terminal domain-containing protein, partial [Oscillospiraceae bacterium]|nr:glycoside hydrolase family 3 C-terminal domain-containing protein [Oscillospiraceae bacterium]
ISKPDKTAVKAYQKQARAEGAQYLKEKKACSDAAETKAFRAKWKLRRKEYKASLRTADAAERKARKKGFRAFKRRIHRGRRVRNTVIALLLIACLVFFGWPSAQMLWRIRKSAKYTTNGSEVDIARASAYALSAELCEEGFVLLKNDNGLLPLAEKKINVFGDDAYRPLPGTDSGETVSLLEALADHEIETNRDLTGMYQKLLAEPENLIGKLKSRLTALLSREEQEDWHMPDASVIRNAKGFSSQAMLVLSALPKDSRTPSPTGIPVMEDGSLQRKLLDSVCKEFDHVILAIASGGAVEAGFLSEYDSIDAVLWIGAPGPRGFSVLAGILAGEINPSGRTTDTWPSSFSSNPAVAGSELSYYANINGQYALHFGEGIYTGYRYYETRFGDDETGYAENVVFPFGHGLSYTEFTEELTSFSAAEETVTAEVTVTNTGETAGKDVVQLYFMAPYDPSRGIEKPAIELAGFVKTSLLEPGETETITVSCPVRDLSSWSTSDGCYLLEAGEYRFSLGKNVHDALLSSDGETFTVEKDVFYRTDDVTGIELQNHFAFALDEDPVLSRSDWEAGSIAESGRRIASDALKEALKAYQKGEKADGKEPAYAKDGSASLAELKGLPYDDEKWNVFLDAFKLNDMIRLVANGAWHTEAISRLGIPDTKLAGEATGIRPIFSSFSTVSYPSEAVIGATWNTALAEKYGETIGAEAAAYGISGLYAPSSAIRRSGISGQSGDLFSEDPLLAGKMAASAISAMQKKHLISFAKNFPFSDAESGLGKNVFTWIDEQTLRELYLRPFELTVKEGGSKGIMVSSACIGVEWCGGSSALLRSILREEWGFDGIVTTEPNYSPLKGVTLAVKNGTDLMFDPGIHASEKALIWAYTKDPSGIAWALRESTHRICYTLVNSTL